MALGHGAYNQVIGSPEKPSQSPSIVTLSSSSLTQSENIAQVGGQDISLGQSTKSGSIPVTLASDQGTISVNQTVASQLYKHINSLTTTTVKSGSGILAVIIINTKGASANTTTVYDSTTGSGTVIAVIDTTANVGSLVYNLNFSTGLTIVTATGTAPDLTVVYQ